MNAYPIPDEALDDRLAFIGTAGAGKTYNALAAFLRVLDRGGRGIWVDPLGVAWGVRLAADGRSASPYPVVIFGGLHADIAITEHAGGLVGQAVATMRESAIVDLSGFATKAAERRFMLAFLDALYRHAAAAGTGEPFHLVLDEADLWAPQKASEPQLQSLTEQIVRRGRVKGFIPWLITQRPAVLSKDVLSQADGLVAFKLTSSQDRDALGAWIDGQADHGEWSAFRRDLPTLPRGEAVLWIPGRGILRRVAFPPKPTLDSSASPARGRIAPGAVALAPLDVTALRDRLASVEADATANDPATLRRRIAELERSPPRRAPRTDAAALAEAERKGEARGFAAGRDATLAAVLGAVETSAADLAMCIAAAARQAAGAVAEPRAAMAAPTAADRPQLPSARCRPDAPPRTARATTTATAALTGPQTHLLAGLAWWRAMGHDEPTRIQLAAIAGWKPRGSNLRNRLSELAGLGLVSYPRDGLVSLTPAGTAAAPAADLSQTLLDAVRGVLTGPQRVLFDALLDAGAAMSRPDLAAAVGWEPGGSNLRNRLSELSALEIVAYPAAGTVALRAWVTKDGGGPETRPDGASRPPLTSQARL